MKWFISLNPVLQGFLAAFFTYLVTASGAGLVFFFKTVNQKILDMMMGFAAGIMIAATFWSLLMPAMDLSAALGGNVWLTSSAGFIIGGTFVIGCDVMISRVMRKRSGAFKQCLLLGSMITLRNIPEGLALGVAFGCASLGTEGATVTGAAMMALAIGLGNFPEGVCVAIPMRRAGASRMKSFLVGQASGIVEPIAGVIGVIFAISVRNALPLILSFSAGAMITVVCSELIPESFADNKIVASFGVIMGFALMLVLNTVF